MWENRPRAALYLRDVVHAGVRPNAGVDKSSGTRLRASDIVAHQCFAWGVCGSVVLRVVSLVLCGFIGGQCGVVCGSVVSLGGNPNHKLGHMAALTQLLCNPGRAMPRVDNS